MDLVQVYTVVVMTVAVTGSFRTLFELLAKEASWTAIIAFFIAVSLPLPLVGRVMGWW